MDEPHKCRDCDEPTLNEIDGPLDGRCRDCDIDYITASGACRKCLRWMIRPEFAGPISDQHAPGCSLVNDPDCRAGTSDELADIRRQREAHRVS